MSICSIILYQMMFTKTHMIQACRNFQCARAFIKNTRPDELKELLLEMNRLTTILASVVDLDSLLQIRRIHREDIIDR